MLAHIWGWLVHLQMCFIGLHVCVLTVLPAMSVLTNAAGGLTSTH